MSGQDAHPHVPAGTLTPAQRQQRPASPIDIDEELDSRLNFTPSQQPTLLDIDVRNGVRAYPPPVMDFNNGNNTEAVAAVATMTLDEKVVHLTRLAEAQQKQMEAANNFAARQAEQLQNSQQQLADSQQMLRSLTQAFESLSAQPRVAPAATTAPSPPKKKPELPPFDSKNILIWIRRIEAAYARVGCTEAKDKFAWLESMFQVKLNPRIDAFLYGENTEAEWILFIQYLKDEYGPTKRQKAQKMLSDNPRHDMKPSQFLAQLEEDTKDVSIDDLRKEHLLKSIQPRIREILGKAVESKTAKEVATMADEYYDRQGRLLEKATTVVNSVSSNSSSTTADSSTPSPTFTTLFSDEETDVNYIKKGGFRGNERGRSRNRGNRSSSRPGFNRKPNTSSTASQQPQSFSGQQQQFPPGTCWFHRKFGEKTTKCQSDCPKFKSFSTQQQKMQGNAPGGRRM